MSDRVTGPLVGDGDDTADFAFDTFADGNKAAIVRFDIGVGTAESRVTPSNPLPVEQTSKATALDPGSVVSVPATASTQVLAANPTRVQATIIPQSDCLMSIGAAASASSAPLLAYQPYNIPAGYKGAVFVWVASGPINVGVWDI